MTSVLSRITRKINRAILGSNKPAPAVTHRARVGGMWDEIGNLQFNFLVSKGLSPDSFLLDVACGCLRLGVRAIPYLKSSHYLAVEKEKCLVDAGIEYELGLALAKEKSPNIVISDSFQFEKLHQQADIAIAQSLFTHLCISDINLCFKNLYPCLSENGVFYATYCEVVKPINNPFDNGWFAYSKDQMLEFGEINGFRSTYIGKWGHPRNQVIVQYEKL